MARLIGFNTRSLPCSGAITDVKLFKKNSHCLFVEEERYKWAEPRSRTNRNLLLFSVVIVAAGLLFSLLN